MNEALAQTSPVPICPAALDALAALAPQAVVHVQAAVAAIKLALRRDGIDIPFPAQVMLFHGQTTETDGRRGVQRKGWPQHPNGDPPHPARDLRIGSDRRDDGERP